MVTKLVENIDDRLWNKFAGYCKVDNKKIGEALSELLQEHIKKREKGKR